MASHIWLRTILIVRKETCCRHLGYSLRLTARVLLYAPSHRQNSTYTAVVTPVMEHWLKREIARWFHPMKDRSDDPSHREQTLLPQSYISLPELGEVREIHLPWRIDLKTACFTTEPHLILLPLTHTHTRKFHYLLPHGCHALHVLRCQVGTTVLLTLSESHVQGFWYNDSAIHLSDSFRCLLWGAEANEAETFRSPSLAHDLKINEQTLVPAFI